LRDATGLSALVMRGYVTVDKDSDRMRFTPLRGNLKVSGSTLSGKVKIKVPGSKPLNGKVSLTANPPVGDGTSCDAVYQAKARVLRRLKEELGDEIE
jgi:hypothetical protein